ncbi:DUF6126 family protein [Streptacidiphilus sp. ASG 303]|uniref:DUF6126 family protein n=1 Tax=Streptacidiphilus sp. ASG 303 TaxID=2896847 RepID=UPI001E3E7058|nr:DUF6126 family protein [Streptacidiphilus sp. ASG 303]MCD0484017.1 DUF6126 family protein [Streptacidiphilus sp. ASG 303]
MSGPGTPAGAPRATPPRGPGAAGAAGAALTPDASAERSRRRGTAVRVFVYVAVTHLWAALLIAMFAVGRR